MRWVYTLVGVLWGVAWLVTPGQAFVSKIRATTNKLPCHQIAGSFKAYSLDGINSAALLTRMNILCECTLAGADITDFDNYRGVLDAIGILEIGNTAGENNTELAVQALRKAALIDKMESYCSTFELNNDALITEAQFRAFLGIP